MMQRRQGQAAPTPNTPQYQLVPVPMTPPQVNPNPAPDAGQPAWQAEGK